MKNRLFTSVLRDTFFSFSRQNVDHQGDRRRYEVTETFSPSSLFVSPSVPTETTQPTKNDSTTTITEPFVAPANRKSSSTNNRTTLRLIDVPGTKHARDDTWPQFFDQIHGWIFVVDSSNKKRLRTSQEALDDLYDSPKMRDKPVLL